MRSLLFAASSRKELFGASNVAMLSAHEADQVVEVEPKRRREGGDVVGVRGNDTWQTSHAALVTSGVTHAPSVTHAPGHNMLVCHVDAGIDFASRCVTYGAFLTTAHGGFLAAINGSLDCVLDPMLAEAMACKEALKWIKSRGVMEVSIQSDCLNLIQVVVGSSVVRSYFGSVIYDCRAISSLFTACVFQYIPRSANQAAHALAKAVGSHAGNRARSEANSDSLSSGGRRKRKISDRDEPITSQSFHNAAMMLSETLVMVGDKLSKSIGTELTLQEKVQQLDKELIQIDGLSNEEYLMALIKLLDRPNQMLVFFSLPPEGRLEWVRAFLSTH
nr:uncharacterized protein LOC109158421 [Ipomoea batatas]